MQVNEAEFRSAKLGSHGAQRSRSTNASTNAFNDSLSGEDERWRVALSTAALRGPQEPHRKLCRAQKLRDGPTRRALPHNTPSTWVQTATMARKSEIDASAIASSTTDFTMTVLPFAHEHKGNIVHGLFWSQVWVVGQFELWRRWLTSQPKGNARSRFSHWLKSVWRKCPCLNVRFNKPIAGNARIATGRANGDDGHDRSARFQLNSIADLEHDSLSLNGQSEGPNYERFDFNSLELVGGVDNFHDSREPPLRIGDRVQLNSGGPISVVVDLDAEAVTIAWRQGEAVFPRPCVHRVRD